MADNYIGFIIVIIIIKLLFIISYLACKCCKSSKGQTFSQNPAAGPVVVQSYPTNPLHQGIFIIQNPQNIQNSQDQQQQRMVLPYERVNFPAGNNESINFSSTTNPAGPKNGPYDEDPPRYDQLFPRL